MHVQVLALAGAMPTSVALTVDILLTANLLRSRKSDRPPFRLSFAGSGAAAWGALFGLRVPKGGFGPPKLVVMPGLGLASADAITERLAAADVAEAQALLAAALDRKAEIATSCSGAFLFAAAGLLAGRRATTTWWLAPLFARLHPEVQLVMDQLIVRDGPVTTAGASLAQMDLMLQLVARFGGPSLAGRCSRYLLLDERRSQSRYMALSFLAASDDKVARAESFARARLGKQLKVTDLADAAGLAPRTFARRVEKATGLSPIRFLQRLRIEAATELIEQTRLPIEEVAHQVGYADPSALRRILRREGGIRPGHLRRAVPA